MHIEKIISQNRRDFKAEYKCGNCGATETKSGYDDAYFHTTVIPAMKCKECGEAAGSSYEARGTKYREGEVV